MSGQQENSVQKPLIRQGTRFRDQTCKSNQELTKILLQKNIGQQNVVLYKGQNNNHSAVRQRQGTENTEQSRKQ